MTAYFIVFLWVLASAIFLLGYITGKAIVFGMVHDHAVSGEDLDSYQGQVYRIELIEDEPC